MSYTIKSKYIDNNFKKKSSWFKRIAFAILIFILMIVSFGSGMYISQRSEIIKELAQKEFVYLGKVIGKYSQAKDGFLIQDIDFSCGLTLAKKTVDNFWHLTIKFFRVLTNLLILALFSIY